MPPTPLSSVRLVAIPDAAPPYDCETHGAGCPATGDQARVADLRAGAGTVRAGTADLRPGDAGLAAGATEPPTGPGGAAVFGVSAAGTGPAAVWPRQFAQVIVEILAGVRPARQVFPWTTDRVRAQIRHLGPVLAADRRPVIKRIVTSRPTARVVEMTVVVSSGPRSRALAMRLEHVGARQAVPGRPARPARWLCTELEAA
ncbi:MAG TPA: Rv3235 family protein [Streptosporangiaceae bacterium]|nr:Rv3235 family protein [Streptosporangiaceae bacterium]